jgi:hypothetical protein
MEIKKIGCPYLKWIQMFRTGSLVEYFENDAQNSGLIKDRNVFYLVTNSFLRI